MSNRELDLLSTKIYDILPNVSISVVGLGGVGSMLCQSLAHIGIKKFTLVDNDVVEDSNLIKLIGSCPKDVDISKKTKVIKDLINYISGGTAEIKIINNKFERDTREEIKKDLINTDFIFSCVDNIAGRLEINDFCVNNKKPFIDFGAGMVKNDGIIESLVGQIYVIRVGDPCLECHSTQNRSDYGTNKVHYIQIHSVLVGLGIMEFLKFLTGFDKNWQRIHYNALEQTVDPAWTGPGLPRCPLCTSKGYVISSK